MKNQRSRRTFQNLRAMSSDDAEGDPQSGTVMAMAEKDREGAEKDREEEVMVQEAGRETEPLVPRPTPVRGTAGQSHGHRLI
jgi:hypothetical protein